MKKLILLSLGIFIAAAVAGCGGGGGGGVQAPFAPSAMAKWNFLVYMNGDNDLEEFAIKDINEMEQIGCSLDVNVLVLIDRVDLDNPEADDTSNGNWTGTRLYRIFRDNQLNSITSQLVQDYGELDMSDPNTLKDFIIYCQTNYPAEKTVLTLWDHGGGVWPKSIAQSKVNTKATIKGISWDDSTPGFPWNCLTTDEIAQALGQARVATGKKIDIINMDACNMQMLEVAYEWRNEADYLVGAEASVPSLGNNYYTLINRIINQPIMSSQAFALALVDDYYNFYSGVILQNSEGTTYSVVVLGGTMASFMTKFTAFASALNATTDLFSARQACENATAYEFSENKDLYEFAYELSTASSDAMVRSTASELYNSISSLVLRHRETQNYVSIKPSFGISILLPNAEEWVFYSGASQYVTLQLSIHTDWDNFILRLVTP